MPAPVRYLLTTDHLYVVRGEGDVSTGLKFERRLLSISGQAVLDSGLVDLRVGVGIGQETTLPGIDPLGSLMRALFPGRAA